MRGPKPRFSRPRHPGLIAAVFAVALVAVALVAGACTGRAAPGREWARADVEQPAGLSEPVPGATVFRFCSPCHSVEQTALTAVVRGGPGFVAVGDVQPGPHGAVWTSVDGRRWTRTAELPDLERSIALAVAASSGGRIVAVGSAGRAAAAWASDHGLRWAAADPAELTGPDALQMAAVVALPSGFVAGGSAQGSDGIVAPAFWTSGDGTHWTRAVIAVTGGGAEATGARVAGIEVGRGGTLLAVGSSGAQAAARAAAWASRDGREWTALAPDALPSGSRMTAVVAMSTGFLAIGSADGGTSAASWTTTDGRSWQRSPDRPDLHAHGLSITMFAVAAGGPGYVAVGQKEDLGNSSGMLWTSADGGTWNAVPDLPMLSGAGVSGVAATADLLVTVGTSGLPDSQVATVWTSPPATP